MANLPVNNQLAIDVNQIPNAFINGQFNISAIVKALNGISGIRVDELKLVDLMFCACHCNGVYLFYDKDGVLNYNPENAFNNVSANSNVVYVGKASSRSFVERIAAHFAPRHWDYMNTLIKRIAEIIFGRVDNVTICDSFQISNKLYLKLIYFDSCNDIGNMVTTDVLEEDLIDFFMPTLNKIPGYRKRNNKNIK